jgi:hypothetical protein
MEKNYIMWSLIICPIQETLLGYKIKEDEVGGGFSTHGKMRNVYRILVGKL